ncbi:phosphoketolase family protein [Streptomyces sp. NBC_00053]|uniref:phosphoketolase family protein n=1 Tax=unclassified Streptomyces TaxID=2593676 RepID=UPI0022541150|nr:MULTISPECIES: phosphoketolase family protein [unclassified Streptomyces]MCX5158179.1 phosphoketolase family protein [Streptomyces sp. NBC_00305]MCX5216702.1 phosphoketolase family protein [Streptomyces sp. NBC_00264]MCX5498496.1 phosphoketolase family protein [Streptomyces sp. NBC_00052]MCX5552972.1 phosphoketolase family protein [Streptomyces sp. NBC_00051]WSC25920.1 phosphoketolase family protein [Streptomyces sp. NBC_01768]
MSNAPGPAAASGPTGPSDEEVAALDAHWRAANYLTVGQIYLMANPLLTRPLAREHIKPRLLGHWGTSPGLNLVHTHLNRVISSRGVQGLCVWGPGHGGPAVLANSWLEGSYSETYPDVTRDAEGMGLLFRQFSFPGGVPSHVAPETPGSIHEGGELGYALTHAYGAALDHPGLIVTCVIGDGEAETGPLAASWHSNKFLDPVHDGAVLPVLHLNGYKIANPTVLARLPETELDALLRGYGHDPLYVGGDEPIGVHRAMAAAMDLAVDRIRELQAAARTGGDTRRPHWPMIVLRTPKGWTGPVEVDGVPVEGTWRAHQVPLPGVRDDQEHLRQLEEWMRSYRPEELFDASGRPTPQVLACVPEGDARLGSTPYANGGLLLRDLPIPPLDDHAVRVDRPGTVLHEPTRVLGGLLEAVMAATAERRDFRVVGPDETASNRLDALYGATAKAWQERTLPTDEHLARDGRVMEVLSEHLCQGWLEGYLLTGRHGLFSCYEAFAHIVDSMVNQHIKWLRTSRRLAWRRPIASLNYLLTSHVWRQDHNGFSHQDPGFVDHILNKSPEVVRVYLPPDANTLLSVADHALRSRDYVNVIVAGKQPSFDWLTIDQARAHCARGAGVWEWAGTEDGSRAPDVVLACAGDVPTLETLAAAGLLRTHLPELAVRVVNVVDMARLLPRGEHPHGMPDSEYDAVFTRDTPVIFAYHGYPWLIHRLAYRRAGHGQLHVRGYKEEGTTTTPFDMVVRNDLDRYRLVMDVIDRVPGLGVRAVAVRQAMADARTRHHAWIREHGTDLPEVADWTWGG